MTWETYRTQIAEKGHLPEDWYILGVDLGTTNSVISYWDNTTRKPEPIDISNGFGKIPLPSVVQYRNDDGNDEWVIGDASYHRARFVWSFSATGSGEPEGINFMLDSGKISQEDCAKVFSK